MRHVTQDESLLCVSAFNDNGQEKYASDPEAIHRSDFFPVCARTLHCMHRAQHSERKDHAERTHTARTLHA